MKSIKARLFACLLVPALAACGATTYQNSPTDFVGGVGASPADQTGKVWRVEVGGNARLARDSALEMLLLKSAETALRNGYPLFEIRNSYDRSTGDQYRTEYMDGVRVGTYRTQGAKPRFIDFIILRDRGEEPLDDRFVYSAAKTYNRYAPIHIGPNAPSPERLLTASGRAAPAAAPSGAVPTIPRGHRLATAAEIAACDAVSEGPAAIGCMFVDLTDTSVLQPASRKEELRCIEANPQLAARNPAACRLTWTAPPR